MKNVIYFVLSLLLIIPLCSCSEKPGTKSNNNTLKIKNILIHDYETGKDVYNYPDKELIKELQDIYDNAHYEKIKNDEGGFGLDIDVLFEGKKSYYRLGYLGEGDGKYVFKTEEESSFGYPVSADSALVSICENYGIKVDYGNSKLYSKEDIRMNGVDTIRKEFDTFKKGAGTLFELSYKGDKYSKSQLRYCNKLRDKNEPKYTECMVFDSFFHTEKKAGGSWIPDEDYTWSWYLAKRPNGAWKILTYGY